MVLCLTKMLLDIFCNSEEETIPDLLKKEPPKTKSLWDDEDVDDNEVKESWEDEDEPAVVSFFYFICFIGLKFGNYLFDE